MMGEPRPLTDFHQFVHNLDFGRGTKVFPGTANVMSKAFGCTGLW
jgi:hypothetical protein